MFQMKSEGDGYIDIEARLQNDWANENSSPTKFSITKQIF